jgi:hypothetical protein
LRVHRLLPITVLLCCSCTRVDPDRCLPDDGEPRSPTTVADALDLIDDLPHPVTAECIIESLERPLLIEATDSFFSVQPARGARSPRIFIFSGDLTLSVVPEGEGSEVIEFAETTTPLRSTKGELALPIEGPLEPSAPFDRVANEGEASTQCGFCHVEETLYDASVGSYDSIALRPELASLVSIGALSHLADSCDPAVEPDRCALLHAIFDHGDVEHHEFPLTYPTIYDE